MKTIIGYGNNLRGEDAFGVDVINQLQSSSDDSFLINTKLISTFQLTPELCLELLGSKKILFIDASYSSDLKYTLSCSLENETKGTNLSHHISPEIIIAMLRDLYNCPVDYEIYSMTTCSFEKINDKEKYKDCIDRVSSFIRKKINNF